MQVIKSDNLTWIDIKNPTEEDIQYLQENFNLHPLVLAEILPKLDYPKVENFGDYLFVVTFYPFFDKDTNSTIPFELDIIIGKDFIITTHSRDIVPLKAIFDKCNLYKEDFEQASQDGPGGILYQIVKSLLSACLPKLNHIKQNIEEAEKTLFQQEYKKTIKEISLIKRDIIGFERVLDPQEVFLKNLVRENQEFFQNKNLSPYFHKLLTLYEQANDILQNQEKILNLLDSTNFSLLQTKTNEIVKTLTIVSVTILPLTILAGLFGMNTKILPIVGVPYDFWVVLGIMLFIAGTIIVYFKSKKWL